MVLPVRGEFLCGTGKVDITPQKLPVIRNGGFTMAKTDKVLDPLHARAMVLKKEGLEVAMVVVDVCILDRELCDQVKKAASKSTGIRPDRMLISATHTHSAPSVMNFCLGTPADPEYVKFLPGKLTEAIERAHATVQPAQAAWGQCHGTKRSKSKP